MSSKNNEPTLYAQSHQFASFMEHYRYHPADYYGESAQHLLLPSYNYSSYRGSGWDQKAYPFWGIEYAIVPIARGQGKDLFGSLLVELMKLVFDSLDSNSPRILHLRHPTTFRQGLGPSMPLIFS